MELFIKHNDSLKTVEKLSPDGGNLLIEGQIMSTLPVRAILTPDQARAAFKLLNVKTVLFLLIILFRRGRK
ncbi:hypothetical protein DM806_20115 [Sphingobium lactosutens]|uniref:hypothetical protein n=1 Tax=Sphingobium lactosutens TaxID=522773 RepID=UPI0015BF5674|nr:hypothetical protein [Sphingobium lactosutens]NWK97921.1 hypothetical protein [Sphingobium lactosutens]